jgi:protein-tyrosine phosphatase
MILRFAWVALLAGAVAAQAEVTDLMCTQTSPNQYKLTYQLTGDTHGVEIFATKDPSGAKGRKKVVATAKSEATVTAGKPGERMYFFVKPDHGKEREVSIRRLPLEGTPNFRDLGGYETEDGRAVRWGVLYRSGVLTPLTEKDMTYLSQLDVRVVCDFRTPQENAEAPERWVASPKAEMVSLPIGGDQKNQNAGVSKLLAGNPTPQQIQQRMAGTYADFAIKASPQYAAVFKQLENDHLPLVYHCSAGKDRTGVFSALVLRSLGVPEKTVIEDYALTNKYFLPAMEHSTKPLPSSARSQLAGLTPEQRHALMIADPDALRATLRTIDSKYGSFDNYRRKELGVSDADLEKLKARLLM